MRMNHQERYKHLEPLGPGGSHSCRWWRGKQVERLMCTVCHCLASWQAAGRRCEGNAQRDNCSLEAQSQLTRVARDDTATSDSCVQGSASTNERKGCVRVVAQVRGRLAPPADAPPLSARHGPQPPPRPWRCRQNRSGRCPGPVSVRHRSAQSVGVNDHNVSLRATT